MFTYDADESDTSSAEELGKVGLAEHFDWLDRDGDQTLTRAEYAETEWLYNTASFGIVAIDLSRSVGDQIAWREQRAVPYITSPILYKGVLFAVKDGGIPHKPRRGDWRGSEASPDRRRCRAFLPPRPSSPTNASTSRRATTLSPWSAQWPTGKKRNQPAHKSKPMFEQISMLPSLCQQLSMLLHLSEVDESVDASPAVADGRFLC